MTIDDRLKEVSIYLDTDKAFAKISTAPIKQAIKADVLKIVNSKAHVPSIRLIENPEQLEPTEQLVKIYDKLLAISYDVSGLDYRLEEYFK